MKARKAAAIRPCTESTRACRRAGKPSPKSATSAPKIARISAQSSMEPSWLPQTPVTLKIRGMVECEFSATVATEKSETT